MASYKTFYKDSVLKMSKSFKYGVVDGNEFYFHRKWSKIL